MKATKKILLTGMACCVYVSGLFAGGILTNTNQSVHFLRNPARGASIEIDAVYTNPAGLAKLPTNGFYFSLNNQSAFQTRTITSTFPSFAGFGGNDTKSFKGEATALVIPSVMGAYKTGKWVVSFDVGVIGGGGTLTFDKGLPSFEAPISMIPLQLSGNGVPTNQYSVDAYFQGSSMIISGQLGATYAISDLFSVYGGARINRVNNGYEGHIRGISINPTHPALNPTGQMMLANTFFSYANNESSAKQTADKQLDCSQSGMGVTPIVGFHFAFDKLNIGAKYEFRTNLSIENKTTVDDTGMFADGVKTNSDIPALLTLGAQYEVIPNVSVSAGYHHFFDSDAKMANDKQQYINGGINEFLLGAEWQINKLFLISAGGQITRTGVTDDFQTDMSFSLNSHSIGFGGAVNLSKAVRLNVAYFVTKYGDWEKQSANYGGMPIAGKDIFSRTNKAFGIGLDFRF